MPAHVVLPAVPPAARPRTGQSRAGAAAPRSREARAGATGRIVESITRAIEERRLMPGAKLSEQKIADRFEVSRTLVRQALHQLSRDRLVTLEPARGAFVSRPGADEAREVMAVRVMLETALVRQLCATLSERQLVELRAHLSTESAAVSRADAADRPGLLVEFHRLLARLSGNAVLEHLLGELLTRSLLIAGRDPSDEAVEAALLGHARLVDALQQRDTRAAARRMEQILQGLQRFLDLRAPPARPSAAHAHP